jgi:hypothetical protein
MHLVDITSIIRNKAFMIQIKLIYNEIDRTFSPKTKITITEFSNFQTNLGWRRIKDNRIRRKRHSKASRLRLIDTKNPKNTAESKVFDSSFR